MARLRHFPVLPRRRARRRARSQRRGPRPFARFLCSAITVAALSMAAACGGAPEGVRARVVKLLSAVTVTAERVTVLGYDRSRFGGWAAVGACTVRDDVVRSWASERPDDDGCGAAGVIDDPYTGEPVEPGSVDVDHIYPLAAAWDFGAHAWGPGQRREFANDAERNLVPVASEVNREKSDLTPAEWLPPEKNLRCGYSARYLHVAVAWELPVSAADFRAMADACAVRVRGR